MQHGPSTFSADNNGNYILGCLCGYTTPASSTAAAAGAQFDQHIASSGGSQDGGSGGGKGV